MLAQVPHDARLIPVAASAEDLATGRVGLPHSDYDALLLKEVLHHVEDRAAVVAGLRAHAHAGHEDHEENSPRPWLAR